jgi:signal transduction histidine kinase
MKTEDINIDKNLPDIPVLLEINPQGIQQVITNLINNSRDALLSSSGTKADKTIEIKGYFSEPPIDDLFVLEVVDNGIGISAENLKKVRKTFFTTKGLSKGTGLGLSIVTGIVESHNGTFEIDSVEGDHTKVTIRLPVNKPST